MNITSGYKSFDKEFGEFQIGEITMIAARPKMGNTSLLMNIGIGAAHKNIKVLYWSMDPTIKKLSQYYALFEMQIIDDYSISFEQLEKLLVENKTNLLIIDYSQTLTLEKKYDVFLSKIKSIAIKNNFSVLISFQINAPIYDIKGTNFRPKLSDLYKTMECEAALNYINKLIFMYVESHYNLEYFMNTIELFTPDNKIIKLHWGEKKGLIEELRISN